MKLGHLFLLLFISPFFSVLGRCETEEMESLFPASFFLHSFFDKGNKPEGSKWKTLFLLFLPFSLFFLLMGNAGWE